MTELAEDLDQICSRIKRLDEMTKSSNSDHLKLSYILNLMRLQRHASYFRFVSGLE
jgi:hypothetical protein